LNTQSGSHHAPDTEAYVAYPISSMNAFRSPAAAASTGLGVGHDGEAMYTLTKEHSHAVAFAQNTRDEVRLIGGDGQIVGALAAQPGAKQTSYVAVDAAHAFKVTGGCEGGGKGYLGSDEVAFTLSTNQDQHIFSEPRSVDTVREVSPTITSNYGKQLDSSDTALGPNVVLHAATHEAAGAHPPAVAFDTYNQTVTGDVTQTLCSRGDSPGGNAHLVPAVAWSIMPMNSGKDFKARPTDVAQPIMAGGPVGGNQGGDYVVQQPMAFAIQDIRGVDKAQNGKGWSDEGVSYTVDTHATQGVAMAFDWQSGGDSRGLDPKPTAQLQRSQVPAVAFGIDDVAHCLRSGASKADKPDSTTYVAQPLTFGETARTLSARHDGSPCADRGPDVVAVAFQSSQSGVRVGDTHATLDANNGSRRHNGIVTSAVRYGEHQQDTLHDENGVLNTLPGGNNNNAGHYTKTATASAVRRLTPRECERLQGFPDDYTAIPYRGKPADQCPDGPRYKALGNSMAVPVMRWIGERIAAVEAFNAP